MSSRTIKIHKIGDRITNTDDSVESTFQFDGNVYRNTVNVSAESLVKDIHYAPIFEVQVIDESLWLVYTPDTFNPFKRFISKKEEKAARHIIEKFFINSNPKVQVTERERCYAGGRYDEFGEDRDNAVNIDDLYVQLREEHFLNDNSLTNYSVEYIQHKCLKAQLKPYQFDAVKWMLNRERIPDSFPSGFVPFRKRWKVNDEDNQTFFFNFRTLELTLEPVSDFPIPTGGILADEMGLGKTVEALALILLNQRPKDEISVTESPSDDDDDGQRLQKKPALLECLCHDQSIEAIVKCIRCLNSQHRACVSQPSDGVVPDDQYICPWCWEKESLVTAKTTLIVSPSIIKMQWMDEVKKHIGDQSFKVCVYDGWQNWRNPKDLASHDIVLTDYATMEKEFTYVTIPETTRTLRNQASPIKKYPSPLLSIRWWRICLDEAQMVASIKNRPAKIVAQLQSVHRWAITGTPIERSIRDLHGLIHFLGCSPYDKIDEWNDVVDDYVSEFNTKELPSILRRIMWRTCKSKEILNQINIPDQTERIHVIDMKDVERINYKRIHEKQFKILLYVLTTIDRNVPLSFINRFALERFLKPLRTLCAYCTNPFVYNGQMKKTMKPDDLLKHLQKGNALDAKSELQKIASTKNHLAALHIINGNIGAAVGCYKDVLQLSEEYDKKYSITVLFLIHAAYNLIAIAPSIKSNDDQDQTYYKKQLIKYESEHLKNKLKDLNKASREHNNCTDVVENLQEEYNKSQRFVDMLAQDDFELNSIVKEARTLHPQIQINYTTKEDVCRILNEWLAKLFAERQKLKEYFNSLQYFMDKPKPLSALDEDGEDEEATKKNEMKEFILKATICHLKGKQSSGKCKVCLARAQHEKYSQVLFDGRGHKPTHQETILKSIVRQIGTQTNSNKKRKKKNKRPDGKPLVNLLVAMKKEFKTYSKLWSTVNDTVTAYSEIEINKNRSVEKVRMDKVNHQINAVKEKLRQTNEKFDYFVWRSKYLENLEDNKEVEKCPICLEKPKDRYAMLRCGHTVCAKCLRAWIKINDEKSDIECSICRNNQSKENICYVNVEDENRLTDSSSRIEAIVRKAVELKAEEAAVKIVIFSHSASNLNELAKQLTRNNIKCCSRLSDKCDEMIAQFKDPNSNITCLLLPLKFGSKGLNLLEATHIFLVEPIIDPAEELQAINRNHRIGQKEKTFVHRFVMNNTVEKSIYNSIPFGEKGSWATQKCTGQQLMQIFASTVLEIIDH